MDQLPPTNKHKPFVRRMYRRSGVATGIQRLVTPARSVLNTDTSSVRSVELFGHKEALDRSSIIYPKSNITQGLNTTDRNVIIYPNGDACLYGLKRDETSATILPKTSVSQGLKTSNKSAIIYPPVNVLPLGLKNDDRNSSIVSKWFDKKAITFPSFNNDDGTASILEVSDSKKRFPSSIIVTQSQNFWKQHNHSMPDSRKMPFQ